MQLASFHQNPKSVPKELQDEESDDDNDAFAAFEAEVEEDDKNTSCMGRVCSFWPIYVSIAMWLIIGCIFYTQVDEWNLAKAFYYTAQSGEEGGWGGPHRCMQAGS